MFGISATAHRFRLIVYGHRPFWVPYQLKGKVNKVYSAELALAPSRRSAYWKHATKEREYLGNSDLKVAASGGDGGERRQKKESHDEDSKFKAVGSFFPVDPCGPNENLEPPATEYPVSTPMDACLRPYCTPQHIVTLSMGTPEYQLDKSYHSSEPENTSIDAPQIQP